MQHTGALAIQEVHLVAPHPHLALTLFKFAAVLHGLRDAVGAAALYRRALVMQVRRWFGRRFLVTMGCVF